MLHAAWSKVTRPLSRLLLQTIQLPEPWFRMPSDVPLDLFGDGAAHDFSWYLEGESKVDIHSLEALKSWLSDCQYMRDTDLFYERDFWQHPRTFELLRRGDCEDFALWAWRKLIGLGYQAEFVAGRMVQDTGQKPGHAWVVFEAEGQPFVLDGVLGDSTAMAMPVDTVQDLYWPEVSVDGQLNRYVYGGFYHRVKESGSLQSLRNLAGLQRSYRPAFQP